MDLNEIRKELDKLDFELVNIIARRFGFMKDVARFKKENNLGIRDFVREKKIIEEKRELVQELGVSPDVIEKIFRILIDESVRLQEGE